MEILYLDKIDSTQKYLINQIDNQNISLPYCVYTYNQTNGIGSRDNSWSGEEDNLYLSFIIDKNSLPSDLKPQSLSIYFGYIFKDMLSQLGSKAILKWPNDIYINQNKIGGIITTIKSSKIICGIGLNIVQTQSNFATLDIVIDREKLVYNFINKIIQYENWKNIFDRYSVEFYNNKKFNFHDNNKIKSLLNAELNSDGSISIDGNVVYSLR